MEKWESIISRGPGYKGRAGTERLKVFKGWIVRSTEGAHGSQCIAFVPDPDHDWEIEPEAVLSCEVKSRGAVGGYR